jgi:hypothetical protein
MQSRRSPSEGLTYIFDAETESAPGMLHAGFADGTGIGRAFPNRLPRRPSALTFERLHWKRKNKNKWDASEIRGCFRGISSAEKPARCSAKCQPVIVRWTKARFPSYPYDDELVLA